MYHLNVPIFPPRHYMLVDAIERIELDDDVLTIPGTRKYHQFEALKPYVLQARRFACFCTACRAGRHAMCMNSERVGVYTVHKCKPRCVYIFNLFASCHVLQRLINLLSFYFVYPFSR